MSFTTKAEQESARFARVSIIRQNLFVSKRAGWKKGQSIRGLDWTVYSISHGMGAIPIPAEVMDDLGLTKRAVGIAPIKDFEELLSLMLDEKKQNDPEVRDAVKVLEKSLGHIGRFPLIVAVFGDTT